MFYKIILKFAKLVGWKLNVKYYYIAECSKSNWLIVKEKIPYCGVTFTPNTSNTEHKTNKKIGQHGSIIFPEPSITQIVDALKKYETRVKILETPILSENYKLSLT